MAVYSKPPKVPNWADSTANILEPSEPYKTLGWVLGVEPPSNFENYRANLIGDWFKWIDERWKDGATSDELVLFDTDGEVAMMKWSGSAMSWLSGTLVEFVCEPGIITAGRSFEDGINLKGVGNAKSIEFDDNINSIKYSMSTATFSILCNNVTPAFEVSGTEISLKKPVVVDADNDVTVSGTGKYKHGTKTLIISAAAARDGLGGGYTLGSGSIANASSASDDLVFPVNLPAGVKIIAARCKISGFSTGTKSLDLLQNSGFVSGTSVGSDSSNSSGVQTLDTGVVAFTMVAGTAVSCIFTSGDSNDKVSLVEIDYVQE